MHPHAVCGQRTSQAISLERGQYQPCPWPCHRQSGVDGGEKGWSHTSPYCWITGDGKAVGFRGRLIACLCSSDSCKQWIKLFPQAKGTCPAEGHYILCLGAGEKWEDVCPATAHTHIHICPHTQCTKGFWKAHPGSQLVSPNYHPEYCSWTHFFTFALTGAFTTCWAFTVHSCFPASSSNHED